jgi:NAD-dependent dihydropyrimidine dehydrogenase PreA subunit
MDNNIIEIDLLLTKFNLDLRTRNLLANIARHLEKNGKSIEDYLEYTDYMMEKRLEKIAKTEKRRPVYIDRYSCSECDRPMILRDVNTNPGNQTGDDSRSVWICPNKNCMHTEYSAMSVSEWKDKLKKES